MTQGQRFALLGMQFGLLGMAVFAPHAYAGLVGDAIRWFALVGAAFGRKRTKFI